MDDELYKERSKTLFRDLMEERKKDKKPFFGDGLPPAQEQKGAVSEEVTTPMLSYENLADRIENGDYDRTVFLRWKKEQSESMKPVLNGTRDLANMLRAQANPVGIQLMLDLYRDLNEACKKYLTSHAPKSTEGRARYALVKKVAERVSGEMNRAKLNAEIYEKSKDDTPRTWEEVLLGEHSMVLNKKQVETPEGVSGNISSLRKIKDGGKEYFFKYREKAPEPNTEAMVRDLTATYKQELDLLLKKEGIYATLSEEDVRSATTRIMDRLQVIAVLADSLVKLGYEKIGECSSASLLDDLKKAGARVEGMNLEAYHDLISELKKKTVLAEGCLAAGIKAGSDIAKRNEATSVLADFLGISDIMMKSSIVTLDVEGEKTDGLRMDAAPGIIASGLISKEFNGKMLHISPEAMRQLAIMQVFDILCGQIDRHRGNYLVQYSVSKDKKDVMVEGVTGIDNDLSFGTLRYQDIVKPPAKKGSVEVKLMSLEKYNKVTKKVETVFPMTDAGFAEKILALKPEMIDLLLGRLLDPDEIRACKDRLKGLQQVIEKEKALDQKRSADEKKFIASLDDWRRFRDRAERLKLAVNESKLKKGEKKPLSKKDISVNTLIHEDYLGEKIVPW